MKGCTFVANGLSGLISEGDVSPVKEEGVVTTEHKSTRPNTYTHTCTFAREMVTYTHTCTFAREMVYK